jgi:hypothetical protein
VGASSSEEAYFREQRLLSSKFEDKSKAFRVFFKVPQTERLLDDFSCAIKGKILLHGRLYVSQNYVCFYSNIFGHLTKIVIEFDSIVAIKKRRLAMVIPNAIEIITKKKKYFFASFMFRNQTYKLLTELWTVHLKVNGMDPAQFIDPEDADDRSTSRKGNGDDGDEESEDDSPEVSTQGAARDEAGYANPTTRQLIDEWDDGVDLESDTSGDVEQFEEKDLPPEMQSFMAEHEVQYKEICTAQYRVPLRKFFDICFADASTCTFDYHTRRGDSEIQISNWQSFGSKFGALRDIRFRSPVKIPFGPKSTRMFFNQRYRWMDKSHLYVELSGYSADVPYGDSFRIESKWNFRETEDRQTKLSIQLGVRFIKSTLWKGRITDGVFKETTISYNQWIDVAQELVEKERAIRSSKRSATTSSVSLSSVPGSSSGSSVTTVSSVSLAAVPSAPSSATSVLRDSKLGSAPDRQHTSLPDKKPDTTASSSTSDVVAQVRSMFSSPRTKLAVTGIVFAFLMIALIFIFPRRSSVVPDAPIIVSTSADSAASKVFFGASDASPSASSTLDGTLDMHVIKIFFKQRERHFSRLSKRIEEMHSTLDSESISVREMLPLWSSFRDYMELQQNFDSALLRLHQESDQHRGSASASWYLYGLIVVVFGLVAYKSFEYLRK